MRVAVRAAGKAGQDLAVVEVFRNQDKRVLSIPTARVRGDGVVSANRRRNSCMRVLLNKNENGTSSLTVHEPHLRNEVMTFKGHNYIEYRKPGAQSVAQTTATASA